MTIVEPCGCINEDSHSSGVKHCLTKCEAHRKFTAERNHESLQYFIDMGAVKDGIPQNKTYAIELTTAALELECLDEFEGNVLEIGCGLGQYIPFFMEQNCNYEAIEPNQFAAKWVDSTFLVRPDETPFENLERDYFFDLIFAAHVFEHLQDAPAMLAKAFKMLIAKGNLFMIVSDDRDMKNPDHYWFFTQDTLKALLEKIGFVNVRTVQKSIVPYEDFIYCIAEKPHTKALAAPKRKKK